LSLSTNDHSAGGLILRRASLSYKGFAFMKDPDEPAIGGARKSLPTGKAHKIQRGSRPPGLGKAPRRKLILDRQAQEEMVKVFGEK
jgi:hypothetical protein